MGKRKKTQNVIPLEFHLFTRNRLVHLIFSFCSFYSDMTLQSIQTIRNTLNFVQVTSATDCSINFTRKKQIYTNTVIG